MYHVEDTAALSAIIEEMCPVISWYEYVAIQNVIAGCSPRVLCAPRHFLETICKCKGTKCFGTNIKADNKQLTKKHFTGVTKTKMDEASCDDPLHCETRVLS